jgi:2-oxoglutarate/2-oxoacid ferredoxin oxidoreductase subunit alpha
MSSIQIYGAGRAGDGTNTATTVFGQALKDIGGWVFIWRDEVYSNIQTRDSGFGLRASDKPIFGPDDEFDILIAFDAGALVDVANEGRIPPLSRLKQGGVIVYDSSARLEYPNAGKEVKLEPVQDFLNSQGIKTFGIPMGEMTKEHLEGRYIVRGTVAQGVLSYLLGVPQEAILNRFAGNFGEGSEVYELNKKALKLGSDYAEEQGWDLPELHVSFSPVPNDARQIILGDEAIGFGAIVAGCRVYAGYPITPASEVLEFMADHIGKFGGAMIQADSEMAAAHHVIGAALAGARSMTATSGPGFDLMQEAISAGGITETPMVIVLCTRGGPATGLPTRQGQEELNEAIFGSHGDFARIVLATSEPEDSFYMMEHVFNLAERYQCPIILIVDQMLAQSSYTVPALDASGFNIDRGKLLSPEQFAEKYGDNRNGGRLYKRYELTEDGISYRAIPGTPGVTNYYSNTNEHTEDGYLTEEEVIRQQQMDKRFMQRMELIKADPQLPKARMYGDDNAKVGFIGYGGVYGPVLEALDRLDAMGVKAKFMELRTLWPLDGEAVKAFIDSCDSVYIPEYTAGAQLRGLVQREATGPSPKLHSLLRYDGRLISAGWIVSRMEEAKVGN